MPPMMMNRSAPILRGVGNSPLSTGGAPTAFGSNVTTPNAVTPAGPLQSGAPLKAPPNATLGDFSPTSLLNNYNQQLNNANSANTDRYNNIMTGYGNLQNQVGGQYNQLSQNLNSANGANAQNVLAGYQQRYNTGMGLLQDAGVQQMKDLNSQYAAQGASQQQGLADQGLSGTTVAPTMAAGNLKAQTGAQNLLNQNINQQKLQAGAQLSGDQLQAQQSLNQYGTNMANQLGQAQIGAQAGLGQNQLNTQERVNQTGPDLGQMTNAAIALGKAGAAVPGVSGAGGTSPGGGLGGSGGAFGAYGAAMGGAKAAPKTAAGYQAYLSNYYRTNAGYAGVSGAKVRPMDQNSWMNS